MKGVVTLSLFLLISSLGAYTRGQNECRYRIERDGCPFLPWDLERIQEDGVQINGKLQNTASNGVATGSGVHIYIIDTGIVPHEEFGSRIGQGLDCTQGGTCRLDSALTDSLGHGTAVSSLTAGSCLGVATGAVIHPIRVIDSDGNGSLQAIIDGIRWATETSAANGWRGVINLSLTSPASESLNEAVDKATENGMVVVTAAGNQGKDACGYSPGSSQSSLNVGASKLQYTENEINGPVDGVSLLSNTGSCVTLYAPGEDIPSASNAQTDGITYDQIVTLSGTSQAAPLVAGAAALFLEKHRDATPQQVKESILNASFIFESEKKDNCCTILNINGLS